jgi:MFS family permease
LFATRWYHGWNVVVGTVVCQAVVLGTVAFGFTLWVGPLMAEFNASRAAVLGGISIYNIVLALISPIAGRAFDVFPSRVLVPIGLAAISIGLLLLSMITKLWQLWLIQATLIPIGATLTTILSAQVNVVRWFSHRRGFALGLSALGTSLGGLTVPLILAVLIREFGWRASFFPIAVAVAIMIPGAWYVFRNRRSEETEPWHAKGPAIVGVAAVPQRSWSTGEMLKETRFWIIGLGLMPVGLCFATIQYNLGPIAQDINVPLKEVAQILSAMAAAMIVGKISVGMLLDHIDSRYVYWLLILILMIAVGFLPTVSGSGGLMVLISLMGFSMGGTLPLTAAIVTDHFGRLATGTGVGLVTSLYAVASAGTSLAGLIRDHTGTYDYVFHLLLLILVLGAGLMFLLKSPLELANQDA